MNYLIVGGAGFIGSHLTRTLLQDSRTCQVRVYDNFSSGRKQFLSPVLADPRLEIITADAADIATLKAHAQGVHTLFHFASNPDIARAVHEPTIDFYAGTLLTQNVIETARLSRVQRVLYASGSGVYGEMGDRWHAEEPLNGRPVSTYGASKLAGETILSAYAEMFGLRAYAFRFANVVGPNQTHGVGYDFLRKLRQNSTQLDILGNGTQTKSYIYVEDVIAAMLLVRDLDPGGYDVFNVSTDDFLTVTEIAELTVSTLQLPPAGVRFSYSGGDRGWKGDVPLVRIRNDKLKSLGWRPRHTSREAMEKAITAMAQAT
jgi:UDP-glucose 4-epimerase